MLPWRHCLLGYSLHWGQPSLQPGQRDLVSKYQGSLPTLSWLMQVSFHNRCSEVREERLWDPKEGTQGDAEPIAPLATAEILCSYLRVYRLSGPPARTCRCWMACSLPSPGRTGMGCLLDACQAQPTCRDLLGAHGGACAEPLWQPGRLWQRQLHRISYHSCQEQPVERERGILCETPTLPRLLSARQATSCQQAEGKRLRRSEPRRHCALSPLAWEAKGEVRAGA